MIVKKKIDPKQLRPHPLNVELWGDAKPDEAFIESVRKLGVLEPLRITSTGLIISGHWRHAAALVCGLVEVPVEMHTDALDDLEIRQLLIEMNRRRPQTTEQRTRAYAALKTIEEQLAKRRQVASGGAAPGKKSGSPKNGEPADKHTNEAKRKAAAKVGMSEPTAEKASVVVQEIDKAAAAGDTAKAEKLRDELNHGSVSSAHRLATNQELGPTSHDVVDELGKNVPKPLHKIFAARSTFKALLSQLRTLKSDVKSLADADGGDRIRFNTIQVDLDNARNHLRFAMPYCLCTYCDGTDKACGGCRGTGWITEAIHDQSPGQSPGPTACGSQSASAVRATHKATA